MPDPVAEQQSSRLQQLIHEEIDGNNGSISFERFMGMALYEPGLGYYSAGARKFGRDGDFTTAPETSSLFSACLARQCEQVFELTGSAYVLELGAGSGVMASDILTELQRRQNLPDQYCILETSADLRERQQQLLRERHPDYFDRIHWLDTLPDRRINGIVLANEVLDAIPVNRFSLLNGTVHELVVGHDGDKFNWLTRPAAEELVVDVNTRLAGIIDTLPEGYSSEINALIMPLLRALSETMARGAIVFIDYGYPRQEYYHPQRDSGTLVCHYRHRSHDDPFVNIGIQDISAFVDFSAVAEHGHGVGLEINGYTSQAAFLLSSGMEQVIREHGSHDETEIYRLSQQAGQLLLPGQMGEKFKVMALSRGLGEILSGFSLANHVHRL